MKSLTPHRPVSLAPGFSRVMASHEMAQPFQRFFRAFQKPLKRLNHPPYLTTRLKPGANKSGLFHSRFCVFAPLRSI